MLECFMLATLAALAIDRTNYRITRAPPTDWPKTRGSMPVVGTISPSAPSDQVLSYTHSHNRTTQVFFYHSSDFSVPSATPTLRSLDLGGKDYNPYTFEILMMLSEAYSKLESGPRGISSEEASRRLREYGPNEVYKQKRTSAFVLLMSEFLGFFPLLLLASSALSLFAHTREPADGYGLIAGALFFVVVINALVSFLQKRKVSNVMESFQSYIPVTVEVLRDDRAHQINARELVPGDVCTLREGDRVPADGLLIRSDSISLNESILTGESGAIVKQADERGVEIYAGSTVVEGGASVFVTATGSSTRFGKTSELTGTVDRELTPLQKEIQRFTKIISAIAIVLGVVFFLIGQFFLANPFWTNLVFAIGIIVANVPEGLLPTVTLALTTASERMARKRALIKGLESVETLGSCTVICTDKTGTITRNEMSVTTLYLNLTVVEPDQVAENPAGHTAMEVMALCNNATRLKGGRYRGDPLETALLEFVERTQPVDTLRSRFNQSFEKTFSSKERYMNKVYETQGSTTYATIKGASEVILERSETIHLDGDTVELTDEHRTMIMDTARDFEAQGLRVIALAYAVGERDQSDPYGLVFVGLVGFLDPPRPNVRSAVKACHEAGIRVIIISGDTPETIAAIARRVGVSNDPFVITGAELKEMDDSELEGAVMHTDVCFARTAPEQKLRIVDALQRQGEIVAVTGDGVNDAPALKKSDLGLAIGSGTDVAKDAADIIILNDDFSTIVEAVREGRTIYANIQRFVSYILTSNTPEILPFLIYVLAYPSIPLAITVIQILAIDLFTDILPAIALGNEKSDPNVMRRPPRRKDDPLVTWKTFAHRYGFTGLIQSILAFTSFFLVLWMGGWRGGEASTALYLSATGAFLATVIAAQIGNVLAIRTEKTPFWQNRWMLAGISLEIVVILILGFVDPLARLLEATPFPLFIWPLIIAAPFIIYWTEKLRVFVVGRYARAVR